MTSVLPTLDRALRLDRVVVVLATLAAVVLLAWAYLLLGAGMDMRQVASVDAAAPWTLGHTGLMLVMWVLMMVAMMLPSAGPMFLLFAIVSRRAGASTASLRVTAVFALAYVCVWTVFALVATGVQWGLERTMLVQEEPSFNWRCHKRKVCRT